MNFYVNPHSADGHGTSSRTTIHRAGCVWAERYGQTPKWRGLSRPSRRPTPGRRGPAIR